MKKLIFLLLLALPFAGFGQAAYLMEFTNMNGSKVVFNLNDVRSCVAEGSGAYLFTRTGSGKTQVQESPATIATNSCGNIVLFTVYLPANQFNTTKQMGVNPNYVVGVVSNTSGDGVLKMINPTENFTTTSTYDAAVALLSICVSGGGGGGSLTNTYVGFGDGLNQLDGEAGFTYDAESNRLAVDTVKTKRITAKVSPLEILGDITGLSYTSSRNDAGAPTSITSWGTNGEERRDGIYELKDSLGLAVPAGRVPYGNSSGNGITSEAAYSYNATTNKLTVDTVRVKTVDMDSFFMRERGYTYKSTYGKRLGMHFTGEGNAFLGYYVGNLTLTGDGLGSGRNIGVGHKVLHNLTSGNRNVGVGFSNMTALTTGVQNVIIGDAALDNCLTCNVNVGIGEHVLRLSTDADGNSAFGWHAGENITTGDFNTLLGGGQIGNILTTGSSNILIGYGVDVPSASSSQRLNIGNTIYGNLANGNVSIGTASTSTKFEVQGGPIRLSSDATDGQLQFFRSDYVNALVTANTYRFDVRGLEALTILPFTAYTGIKKSLPTEQLDVAGNIRLSGALMPNNLPGTSGQVLISGGAGNPATWGSNGVTTLAAVGSTANANGATISGSTLNLEPASATHKGVISLTQLKFPLKMTVVDGNTEVPGAGLQTYEVIRIPACYNGYSISDVSYGVWKTGATGTAEMQIRRNGSGTAGVTFTAGQAVKDVTLTGVTVSTGDLIDVEIISNSMATPQQGLWVTIFLTPN